MEIDLNDLLFDLEKYENDPLYYYYLEWNCKIHLMRIEQKRKLKEEWYVGWDRISKKKTYDWSEEKYEKNN